MYHFTLNLVHILNPACSLCLRGVQKFHYRIDQLFTWYRRCLGHEIRILVRCHPGIDIPLVIDSCEVGKYVLKARAKEAASLCANSYITNPAMLAGNPGRQLRAFADDSCWREGIPSHSFFHVHHDAGCEFLKTAWIWQLFVKQLLSSFHEHVLLRFLTPQPVHGADVYLLRWVMHDWSDKYCVKILQALVPALKKGARVLVNDICISEPCQLGVAADRGLHQMDVSLKAFSNTKERDGATSAMLFAMADGRLKFMGITLPPGARAAIIKGEWAGGDLAI